MPYFIKILIFSALSPETAGWIISLFILILRKQIILIKNILIYPPNKKPTETYAKKIELMSISDETKHIMAEIRNKCIIIIVIKGAASSSLSLMNTKVANPRLEPMNTA